MLSPLPEFKISFEMDDSIRSKEGFDYLNGKVLQFAGEAADALTKFAYCVSIILEEKLYAYAETDAGEPMFRTQLEYLEYLDSVCVLGTSTVQMYHSSLKLARALGYKTLDDIIATGGIDFWRVIKQQVKTNSKNGEPLALMSGEPPSNYSVKDWVKNAVKRLVQTTDKADMTIRSSEFRTQAEVLLQPGKPQIWFARGNEFLQVIWNFRREDEDGIELLTGSFKILPDTPMPPGVLSKVLRGLSLELPELNEDEL